ncbi:MAG: alpha/beta hydrolase [Lentilactobacillus hilgardii]|uniref:alpha/beta hydrolase n=1 Tax=Lentilactobacillus hilgardii TaxID=1588 RepID=UPI001CC2053F|nr:alpha/beta hydrolase [Lentilactobacillus hilgardii]MBZ2201549.1 hydrolase [Lentilactobacillus hilgardii]MBZ2204467.1 hydrolase [Lentilactobacillus hilgardii]
MMTNRHSNMWRIGYFALGSIIFIAIGLFLWHDHQDQERLAEENYINSNTPTLFIHGWGGTLRSEKKMASDAEASDAAQRRMIIRVRPNGKIDVTGTIEKWMRNPIIFLRMDNNRAGEFQYARWLTKVCKLLKSKYHIDNLNFVGHSMGSYATVYYNMINGNRQDLPRANKLCLLAGPYNGIINNGKQNQPITGPLAKLWDDQPNANKLLKNGRPKTIHPEYQMLNQLKDRIPRQIRILNIYGDLNDGSNSDGVVTTESALSLGYLVKGRVNYYQTFKATGPNAQHSELHNHNLAVDRSLTNFLWGKHYNMSSSAPKYNPMLDKMMNPGMAFKRQNQLKAQ